MLDHDNKNVCLLRSSSCSFVNIVQLFISMEILGESNKEISVRLGNLWKNLSAETKQSYYRSAQLEHTTQTTLGKKVMQRRKTIDSSLNWESNEDEVINRIKYVIVFRV